MSEPATGEDTSPLSGIRVVEMGQLLAGPFCGQLLADFGAEVIKVEEPGRGDPMRQWGREAIDDSTLWWPIIARNKKSVTLDLRTAEGQGVARRLVDQADVLLENFRPGTLERWGLDYDSLSASNPGLILIRVTGFGQDGPYAQRAGYGSIGEAMGGLRYVTGDPATRPSRVGISIGDSLAGVFAALGGLMAIQARARTGRGQVVDAAIFEAVLAMMESLVPEYALGGFTRERTGAILPKIAPSNVYQTADGDMILIGANQDTVFRRLADVMERPELAEDPRFATHHARGEHQQVLDDLIDAWTQTLTADDLLERLHTGGVPAGRIYRAADMLDDPHFAARRSIVDVEHPTLGKFPMQGVFPVLSATPGRVTWPGPELGAHNLDVYCGLLGLSERELDELRQRSVV